MRILAALLLCAFRIQAADSTNEVKLAVGQTYSIDLDSNPTTGYSWRLVSPTNSVFMLVTNTYEPRKNTERLVGSGGMEHWTFKAVGPAPFRAEPGRHFRSGRGRTSCSKAIPPRWCRLCALEPVVPPVVFAGLRPNRTGRRRAGAGRDQNDCRKSETVRFRKSPRIRPQ